MSFLRILSAAVVALATALPMPNCWAQAYDQAQVPARDLAERSLQNYVQAIKPENVTRFGFKDLSEAKAARLGDAMPVFMIELNKLKAYRAGAGAASVLTDARSFWFPVLVNGEVRSKLEVAEVQGKWVAGEFGRPALARAVASVRRDLPATLQGIGMPPNVRVSLVRIPSLFTLLFFVTGPGGDFFVPVRHEGLPAGIEVGKAQPADALLVQLSAMAQKVDEKTVR